MTTLELSPKQRTVGPKFAAFVGCVLTFLLFLARHKYFPSANAEIFVPADLGVLALGIGLAVLMGSQSLSVSLDISNPAEVVRTSTWFGKFTKIERTPLINAAWTRIVYADEGLLSVEVGTFGHQTTSVVCLPYSEENIPVAEQLCTKVASALHIENKGYHRVL